MNIMMRNALLAMLAAAPVAGPAAARGIDFGDDSGQFAHDNECDDARFERTNGEVVGMRSHVMRDASDCQAELRQGLIRPRELTPPSRAEIAAIDFGDDSGPFAHDRECDDRRFADWTDGRIGMFQGIRRDASDCRAEFALGLLTYVGQPTPPSAKAVAAIDFGDDSSEFAHDDDCDDMRFRDEDGNPVGGARHIRKDASDCRMIFEAGFLTFHDLTAPSAAAIAAIDFGDDSGQYANDGECDDGRFYRVNGVNVGYEGHVRRDASDCRAEFSTGALTFRADDAGGPGGRAMQGGIGAGIDFGDDSGEYANDGECDDARFLDTHGGRIGMASHIRRDASDCREAVDAGDLTFCDLIPRSPAQIAAVDFGDDSSEYAHDGACDDARFSDHYGPVFGSGEHIGRDASDCRSIFALGLLEFNDPTGGARPERPTPPATRGDVADIDYGDDSGEYAHDDECDDARFVYEDGSRVGFLSHIGRDASDCRAEVASGQLIFQPPQRPSAAAVAAIDFGDDRGQGARDGQCDDPRFIDWYGERLGHGIGMRHDATDCREGFEAGFLTFSAPRPPSRAEVNAVDFGNDSGEYAHDNECDDPRFYNLNGGRVGMYSHLWSDASDCRADFSLGLLTFRDLTPRSSEEIEAVDFGDDSGRFANDNECDDARFVDEGGQAIGMQDHILRDASDCKFEYEFGLISLAEDAGRGGSGHAPRHAPVRPRADTGAIDFGDNSGRYVRDGECDDGRFEGPGAGFATAGTHSVFADADDCERLFIEGQVTLRDVDMPQPGAVDRIDFGDDSGRYANDGECDDPRFEGAGSADGGSEDHRRADASDCRAAFEFGFVTLKAGEAGTTAPRPGASGSTPRPGSGTRDIRN